MEKPAGGGSFIRQKNGSLVRCADDPEAPATPPVTQPEPKPAARTPRAATTKDK